MIDLYRSPIDCYVKRIGQEIAEKTDAAVMKAVEFEVGTYVDKEELIKALAYDRDQYNKGVADGKLIMSLDFERFYNLRKKLFKAIKETGECGKTYEGAFTVYMEMPDYYDDPEAGARPFGWHIHLDCYLVGPYRHYDWRGKSFAEALNKCEREILSWIEEDADE